MKKKGFTLIELLAVIIILAIVALIATPMILDVVEDARASAAKSETNMIISGVNNYCAAATSKDQLNNTHNSICLNSEKNGYQVTAEEIGQMVKLGNAKIHPTAPLVYSEKGLVEVTVESNGYSCMLAFKGASVDADDFKLMPMACKKGVNLTTEQLTAFRAEIAPTTP